MQRCDTRPARRYRNAALLSLLTLVALPALASGQTATKPLDPNLAKKVVPAKPAPRPVIRNATPRPQIKPSIATPNSPVVRKQVQRVNPASPSPGGAAIKKSGSAAGAPIVAKTRPPVIKPAVPKVVATPPPTAGSGGSSAAAKKPLGSGNAPALIVTTPKGFNPNWIAKPAPGLVNIKPLGPPKVVLLAPKLPPAPAPKWVGPPWGLKAPKLAWYPWAGRSYFPYFFVGTVAVVGVVGYNYWSAPPPSCYAAGSVIYYYPGTKVCFDFATAREEDPFECHGKIFRWKPSRYRAVETLIETEAPLALVASEWIAEDPQRLVEVSAAIDRAALRSQSVAASPLDQLDCSTCLSALGPTPGDNGQCTVSLVNNCDHEVTVSGGLAKTSAGPDTPTLCDFQGDVPAGTEVAACTRPCGEFTDAQIFLNAVVPVLGTPKPAPACRIVQKQASAN